MNKKSIYLIALVLFFSATRAIAHEFKWENLMIASVKLQPQFDYEANIDSYMKLFRPDIWNRYRNDEFELYDKRQETIKMLRARVSSFSLEETFVLYTTFEFGKYDFKKQAFPLSEALNETTYFYADQTWNHGSFPSRYIMFFKNPQKLGDINMGKEEARGFLNQRKDRYGNIDRRIYAKMECRVTGLKKGRDELEAELTHIIIYDDETRKKVLQKY